MDFEEFMDISEDELMHYGRKGMKWGENIFERSFSDIFGASPQAEADKRLRDAEKAKEKMLKEQEKQRKEEAKKTVKREADSRKQSAQLYSDMQKEKEANEKALNKQKDKLIKDAQKAHDKEQGNFFKNTFDDIFNKEEKQTKDIERYDPELARSIAEGKEVYISGQPKAPDKNNVAIKPKTDSSSYNFLGEKELKDERQERRENEKQARIENKENERKQALTDKKDELLTRSKKEEMLRKAYEEKAERERAAELQNKKDEIMRNVNMERGLRASGDEKRAREEAERRRAEAERAKKMRRVNALGAISFNHSDDFSDFLEHRKFKELKNDLDDIKDKYSSYSLDPNDVSKFNSIVTLYNNVNHTSVNRIPFAYKSGVTAETNNMCEIKKKGSVYIFYLDGKAEPSDTAKEMINDMSKYYNDLYGSFGHSLDELYDICEDDGKSALAHIGIRFRSGRYPWGSGERPHQHDNNLMYENTDANGNVTYSWDWTEVSKAATEAQKSFQQTGRDLSAIGKAIDPDNRPKAKKNFMPQAKQMTDEELRNQINRMRLEQDYNRMMQELNPPKRSRSEEKIKKVLTTAALVAPIATATGGIVMNIITSKAAMDKAANDALQKANDKKFNEQRINYLNKLMTDMDFDSMTFDEKVKTLPKLKILNNFIKDTGGFIDAKGNWITS